VAEDTPNNQDLPFLAAVFTGFLCAVFGANAVAIKISLAGLGAFTAAGLRFSMAAVAIFLWAAITRRSFGIKKGQAYQLLVLGIMFFVQLSLLYLGLSRTNASRGTLLINTQPFFILFLAHFFIPGDGITKRKLLGLLMGFAGLVLFFLQREGITSDIQVGDLLILMTAFFWACSTVYMKRIINAYDPFQLVLYPMIFSIPFFFLAGLLWDGKMIEYVNSNIVISLLYQGLVTGAFGFVAWNGMLRKYGAVSLHSFIFIMPVAGVLLGGLILGEPITLNIILALLLIVSGILVVNLKTRRYFPLFPTRGV